MSIDRSLKTGGALARHRNVLTRAERLLRLAAEERRTEADSVFGLPKVGHRNVKVGKKKTKKDEEAATPGAAAPAAAAAAPAKAGAKPAAKPAAKGGAKK